jgi:hypothetical protein
VENSLTVQALPGESARARKDPIRTVTQFADSSGARVA